MNTLIGLGTLAAFFQRCLDIFPGNFSEKCAAIFITTLSAIVITLIILGRYFEA